MAILIEDLQMEHLAQQLAKDEGVTIAEIIREGLLYLAKCRGLQTKEVSLRQRLTALANEIDALPGMPTNHLSDNEIVGYNEHGIW